MIIDRVRWALIVSMICLAGAAEEAYGEALPEPSHPVRTGEAGAILLSQYQIELTLSDAIYLGLRRNRAIRSAYLERIAQKFDLRVAEDIFNPKLQLNGRYTAGGTQADRYRKMELTPDATMLTPYGTRLNLSWSQNMTAADNAGRMRNDGASLSIIQPLLRGAGREVATAPVRLARLGEQSNRLNLKASVMDTITQIIRAYREVMRAQEHLQIADSALERSRELLAVNAALIESGRMAAFDMIQTEAEVATQELAVEEGANMLAAQRLALLQLLALDLNTPLRVVDRLEAQPMEVQEAAALALAEGLQPAYLNQLIATARAEIGLVVANDSRRWNVSLVGSATQARDRFPAPSGRQATRSWERYVGIQLEIPVGDLSTRQAQVQAQVEVQTQQVSMEEARQQLARDIGNAVRNIGARWRQFGIAQRALDLSRQKLQIEQEKLMVGRSSNFQVLSFEADLRNAENTRLNALISYLDAQTALDQIQGTALLTWEIELND